MGLPQKSKVIRGKTVFKRTKRRISRVKEFMVKLVKLPKMPKVVEHKIFNRKR